MKREYDFSNAKRGPVITAPHGKTRITIRIDQDVLAWFKKQVVLAGGGNYQTLINQALREFIDAKNESLEEILRRVIREEVQPKQDPTNEKQTGTPVGSAASLQLDASVMSQIADTCRRWNIRRLALFGSAIRHDFGPESDIDVLVEFEPDHVPGFGFITIQDELAEIFSRPVDLHTPATLSRYFRDDVLDQARDLYDAA